ncbi:uncharacterized protein I303_102089 [Kwoniella dejecticola CBS 10117]|uniref:Uncharacterized protein n=1 Tax=Kwoniella dejecticola CBS 10117 TaxID=1296121 RepID=A0A1A6ABX3_9TREE|nr:uncharacterized protein I303_01770 [Kwoniella dejecticola CBS 10117]OBR87562.1 hypothetical protein I303_01770 [Kwoniella dejecticola CBS 10117]
MIGEENPSPTKSHSRTLDQSWLSISDDASSGIPSAGLSERFISDEYEDEGENQWGRHDERYMYGLGAKGALNADDGERTITGIESSRWSAILSERDESFEPEADQRGPTEASLIRDAYLRMVLPQPPSPTHIVVPRLPGPEQGDSHTILMAYA